MGVTILRHTNRHARPLRAAMTDAERKLWSRLRNRQLGGMKFRRQHSIAGFIADFACIDVQLVIEADGGQHDAAAAADTARTQVLTALGWQVLRFWNREILTNIDGVLTTILAAATDRTAKASPLPLAGEVDSPKASG